MIRWPFSRAPFDIAKRLVLWLATGLTIVSGYALTKLEPWAEPVLLPMTAIDHAIPFVPATVWLYGSLTTTALLAWLMVPNQLEGRRIFFSAALAAVLCWVFFAFWPTTFPRELYPLPNSATGWFANATLAEFNDLRQADSPTNCFPSQHVALVWAMSLTWAGFLVRPWSRPLPILYAIGVSVCTLTTKQHYLVDVAGGFAIGVFSWGVLRYGVTAQTAPFWARFDRPLELLRQADRRTVSALRERVERHQWALSDVPWPQGPLPTLDPIMVRLINQVIYIEEIAGLNFKILGDGSKDPDLRRLYHLFADEERRHADGLRRVLELHGHVLQPPGLGNALVLDQFDNLNPKSDADLALVCVSNPVFETFLDAGTIPFLQGHPALNSPAFDVLVDRLNRDEGAHLALGWLMTRQIARQHRGLKGLRILFNPAILRGIVAVPFMSLDVYSLAYRLGFNFESLLPAFGRLWGLHKRYPELWGMPMWWSYRLFVVCGWVATLACIGMHRAGVMFGRLWTTVTQVTDAVAWGLFGPTLLNRRALPPLAPESDASRG